MSTEDRYRSPHTGWTRAHWAQLADRMLLAVRPYASTDHARIDLPGPPSAYGRDSDALEAFARTFLLAAIRLRGESGDDPHHLAAWYAAGLRAGTDPSSPTAWPRPDDLAQAKVEAASIALGLHLTRPWLWDRLSGTDRGHIVDWLGAVVGEEYPPINWVWFQIVVETFLRSVDGPWSPADIERGLAVHESLYRGDGWYSDGTQRAFDHYGGWALHLYPLLWADMAGDLCPADLRLAWRERLARFLDDAVLLVGGDGSPLLQGRSLTYRFAAAAPFWLGAMTGATNLAPGLIRRTCSGMVRHFQQRGAPDDRGLLTLGWHRAWPAIAQSYSGPGSPYWAAKGMLGLALPATHPVWCAVEEPLPVERADTLRALPVPGWLVSGTRGDGLVRVVNHGTDHCEVGDRRADAPLYARLGYSTATVPPLGPDAAADPPDNAVTVVDAAGRAAHRTGFRTLECRVVGQTAVAVSRAELHWVDTTADTGPDHGSGRAGPVRPGPTVTVGSVLRGAVEVRAARIDSPLGPPAAAVLEFSGWPVAADEPPAGRDPADEPPAGRDPADEPPAGRDPADEPPVRRAGNGDRPACRVAGAGLVSGLVGLAGLEVALVRRQQDTSPLGAHVAVPVLRTAGTPRPGTVYLAVVRLHGDGGAAPLPEVGVVEDPGGHVVSVRWSDGQRAALVLPAAATEPA